MKILLFVVVSTLSISSPARAQTVDQITGHDYCNDITSTYTCITEDTRRRHLGHFLKCASLPRGTNQYTVNGYTRNCPKSGFRRHNLPALNSDSPWIDESQLGNYPSAIRSNISTARQQACHMLTICYDPARIRGRFPNDGSVCPNYWRGHANILGPGLTTQDCVNCAEADPSRLISNCGATLGPIDRTLRYPRAAEFYDEHPQSESGGAQ